MNADGELSDKEWRQMRRQMSKLDFEPVPETPALLPRSLYGENEEDLVSTSDEGENSDTSHEPTCHCSPKHRSGELPSTSIAVSPLITRRFRPPEHSRPPEKQFELNDTEIAAIDAQMAAAQETTRQSIMRAFVALKAKKTRSEALERMKLSAAHTSDVKILQDNVEKLKEQVAQAEAQREQRDLLLDRFSLLTAKKYRLNVSFLLHCLCYS
ncbi:hypothetical protein PHMEG_0005116 [Phytophthora megakarya]|uniref:Uncharacterized protein n=1 Tax=Phytophthora megakarya TaxID=4795 RepID=A0A225WTN0_9STRA|nr:hypothetical protein PHMEG_0005116 [Phytophthora megakarya]